MADRTSPIAQAQCGMCGALLNVWPGTAPRTVMIALHDCLIGAGAMRIVKREAV